MDPGLALSHYQLLPIGQSAGVIYTQLQVQVHTTTHSRFYREQLGPVPPKADPAWINQAGLRVL